jgi:hypothetical protein
MMMIESGSPASSATTTIVSTAARHDDGRERLIQLNRLQAEIKDLGMSSCP